MVKSGMSQSKMVGPMQRTAYGPAAAGPDRVGLDIVAVAEGHLE